MEKKSCDQVIQGNINRWFLGSIHDCIDIDQLT